MKRLSMVLSVIVSFFWTASARSQAIPFDSDRWQIDAVQSAQQTFLDRPCLMLKGGIAWIKDAGFTDGIIEFDVAFTGERGFMGAVWRLQDADNFEQFYIRPHQSGKPDANQYTPVFHGVAGWQLYHGKHYGSAIDYEFNVWTPVKIIVSAGQAEVYVRDMAMALLQVVDLKRGMESGGVGLSAGNFAPAYFSNFRFEAMQETPALASRSEVVAPIEEGTVQSWSVSDSFSEAALSDVRKLDTTHKDQRTWIPLKCEATGLANLARVRTLATGRNAVFVRLVVLSELQQDKCVRIGYSDRAKVFLNDQLLYRGDNTYRSRDFRYLGTIGLFDSVCLPLREGRNELWIAVSESFGGWGVMAQFEDLDGLTVQAAAD